MRLGVVQLAPVALAAFAEGAWAWFDPDLFLALSASTETDRLVERTNNYFQNLYRSALAAGLRVEDPAVQRLDGSMSAWVDFKADYDSTVFKWTPWGRDWAEDLEGWRQEWLTRREDLRKAAGKLLEQELAARGVDPNYVRIEEPGLVERVKEAFGGAVETAGQEARRGIMLPLIGVGLFGLAMVWVVAKASQPRAA
jgi:hypothetical protein